MNTKGTMKSLPIIVPLLVLILSETQGLLFVRDSMSTAMSTGDFYNMAQRNLDKESTQVIFEDYKFSSIPMK